MAQLAAEAVTTTKNAVEFILTLQDTGNDENVSTRTLSLDNPVTTAAGLSAIADFRDFLLEDTWTGHDSIAPRYLFQPANAGTTTYRTTAVKARIVQQTTTITDIE